MAHSRGQAAIGIEAIFVLLAIGLILAYSVSESFGIVDRISSGKEAFLSYGKALVKGDEALLNPREGLAKTEFGRPKDHFLKALPENVSAFDVGSGERITKGREAGFCSFRYAYYSGRSFLLLFCSD